jgi:hypothetical protein
MTLRAESQFLRRTYRRRRQRKRIWLGRLAAAGQIGRRRGRALLLVRGIRGPAHRRSPDGYAYCPHVALEPSNVVASPDVDPYAATLRRKGIRPPCPG